MLVGGGELLLVVIVVVLRSLAVEAEVEGGVKVDAEVDAEDVDVDVDGGGGRLHIGCWVLLLLLEVDGGLDPDALDDVLAPLELLETSGILPDIDLDAGGWDSEAAVPCDIEPDECDRDECDVGPAPCQRLPRPRRGRA